MLDIYTVDRWKRIHKFIESHPFHDASEVAECLDLSITTVNKYKRMKEPTELIKITGGNSITFSIKTLFQFTK